MSQVRGAVRLMGLGATTAVWLGAVTLHQKLVRPDERYALFQRHLRLWSRTLVWSTGGRLHLTPDSRVPPQRGARLIVANHRSPFDIGVLLSLFGGHALSRADLARWPILGAAARQAGTIFVDRESASSGASAIRAIRKRLSDGASVLVFPEGKTFAGDEVQPFKAGVFSALRGLDVEIVPVGIAYEAGSEFVDESFVHHVLRVARRPVTPCAVHIGEPVMATGKTALLAQNLQERVQSCVLHARGYLQGLPR